MREFRQLAPNAIHESPTNPQRPFSDDGLDARTAGVHPEDIQTDELFLDVLGMPDPTVAKRYPLAIAVALARRHGWQPDDLVMFQQAPLREGDLQDLAAAPSPPTPDPEPPSAPTDWSRKSPKRA